MRIRWLLTFSVLFSVLSGFAQFDTSWSRIESDIRSKHNLITVDSILLSRRGLAWAAQDYISYSRALYDDMKIRDLRSEDSCYFRNSSFIDSLLLRETTPQQLRLLLHLMQAKRLMEFNWAYHRFQRNKYETPDLPFNYAAYDQERLDSLIHEHVEMAIDRSGLLDALEPAPLLWLAADPMSFLFKPHWNDMVFGAQVGYLESGYPSTYRWPANTREWMNFTPPIFSDTLQTATGAPSLLHVYGQWLRARRDNPEAYAFIETLARKSLFDHFSSDSVIAGGYEQYLMGRLKDRILCVRAYAVYQLCLAWHQNNSSRVYVGDLYYTNQHDYSRSGWSPHPPNQVLDLFETNKTLLVRYGLIYRILETMKSRILAPYLSSSVLSTAQPDKPILLRLSYRNAANLFYRFVRVGASEAEGFEMPANEHLLREFPAFREASISLPLPPDHLTHRTFVKINPLPAGHYYLLFSDQPILDSSHKIGALPMTVTALLPLHTDDRVSIIQSGSGQPAVGVHIAVTPVEKETKPEHLPKPENVITGKTGVAIIRQEGEQDLQMSYRDDTILERAQITHPDLDEVMDGSSRDDAEAFFRDNTQLSVYTDRGIYRPGQTVHFKGVLLTRNALTGEPTLLTRETTANAWGKNGLDRWLKQSNPKVYLYNPFNDIADSFAIRPDDYGSFSGNFVIPAASPTGEWRFDNDDFQLQQNTGVFHVEEYKRPSFDLSILPPTRTYLPGDSIYFTTRVRSLSGGSMAGTIVRYTISREYSPLLAKQGVTGPDGRLVIGIRDTVAEIWKSPASWPITKDYTVEVTAIDPTGESHETKGTIRVSNYPVRIRFAPSGTYLRGEIPPFYIETKDPNGLGLSKTLLISVYAKTPKRHWFQSDYSDFADQWLYSPKDLQKWFPDIDIDGSGVDTTTRLVYSTRLQSGTGEKMSIPKGVLTSGQYHIVVQCEESHHLLGMTSADWTVLDTTLRQWPADHPALVFLPYNSIKPGEKIRYYAGAAFDSTRLLVNIRYISHARKRAQIVSLFLDKILTHGVHGFEWPVPKDVEGQVTMTFLFIYHRALWRRGEVVWINRPAETPVIRIEQFRNPLTPGETAQFSLSVRANNAALAAQVMTTMYDAALDELQPYRWEMPEMHSPRLPGNEWPYNSINQVTDNMYGTFPYDRPTGQSTALPWLSDSMQSELEGAAGIPSIIERNVGENPLSMVEGSVPGIQVTQVRGLDDVVVVGYSATTAKRLTTASMVTIRGQNAVPALESGALIILDGVVYPGKLTSIDLKTITDGILLEGADATAIYGTRGAHGVLVLSTKGPVQLPKAPEAPPVMVRGNFSELAFFSPDILRDASGNYTFTFTLPESVTEWTWQILAQLKPAHFVYGRRNFSTRLPIMIEPYVPRLLYAGDHITLKARISNLDSTTTDGWATCILEDAITGKDITTTLCNNPKIQFHLRAGGNATAAFSFVVPPDALHDLRIILKATTAKYADAEVQSIPVMPARILIRQEVPFQLSDSISCIEHTIATTGRDALVGIGVSLTAPPTVALLNALPWLADYSIDCAEQTFNKVLARATALDLMHSDPGIRTAFEGLTSKLKIAPVRSLPPDEPLAGTMPWLNSFTQKAKQQTELIRLLDTSQTQAKIEALLARLYGLQNPDGGISWFDGGTSDSYISAYLLAGFGKLKEVSWRFHSNAFDKLPSFFAKLIGYIDTHWTAGSNAYWAYCRYLWQKEYPVTTQLRDSVVRSLTLERLHIDDKSLYQQSLWIIDVLHYFASGDTLYDTALRQLEHIYQRRIEDNTNGLRWKEISDDDDLTTTQEETVALLFEAFTGSAHQTEVQRGLLKWLLVANTDHHWKTTKATAAVINLLRKEGRSFAGSETRVTCRTADAAFALSDDPFAGQSFMYLEAKKSTEKLELSRTGAAAASGSIITWTLRPLDSLRATKGPIRIHKSIYVFNEAHSTWDLVNPATYLQVGDRIKTVLTLETDKPVRYVYIADNRSAALEPIEVMSGYAYESGLSFYKSIRDAGCQFFCDFIPSGRWQVSYENRVAQKGEFYAGAAFLQCMYKPEINAYSNAEKLTIK